MKTSFEKHMHRREKIKFEILAPIVQKATKGFTLSGQKRVTEASSLELPEVKVQRQGERSPSVICQVIDITEARLLRPGGTMLVATSSASKVRTSLFPRSSLLSIRPFFYNPLRPS